MLHLPYTSMVLSFVVVGAVLSPRFSWVLLLGTLAAYFAALGIGAHFLDQLPGMGSNYVRHWPNWALWTIGISGVSVGVVIGIIGAVVLREPVLLLFVLVQGICALGYPLAPLFRGALHRDSVFAVSWGSLPCLTSYYAQSGSISVVAVLLAAVFAALAVAEIRVSRMSRAERRRVSVDAGAATAGSLLGIRLKRRPDVFLGVLSLGTTLVAVGLLASRFLLAG
ncbi:MAG: hypothetical protein WA688_00760 [Thermoplasmata archaeon]